MGDKAGEGPRNTEGVWEGSERKARLARGGARVGVGHGIPHKGRKGVISVYS